METPFFVFAPRNSCKCKVQHFFGMALRSPFSSLNGRLVSDALPAFCSAPLIPSLVRGHPRGARSATAVPPWPPFWLQLSRSPSPATATLTATPTTTTPTRTQTSLTPAATDTTTTSNRRQGVRLANVGVGGGGSSGGGFFPSSSRSSPTALFHSAAGGGQEGERQPTEDSDGNESLFSGTEGAEWAGWECRFSGEDGGRIAVPEDYVPESLREWEVEVWGFETLTSERRQLQQQHQQQGNNEDSKENSNTNGVLYRKRGRVFPEVGCALDNLSLEVNAQTSVLEGDGIFLASFPGGPGGAHLLGKKPAVSESLELDLEAGLLFPGRAFVDDSMAQTGGGGDEGEAGDQSRARVEFRLKRVGDGGGGGGGSGDGGGCALGPMVTVTRERQYRHGFDDGLLYKGGGLDSQQLRGLLQSKCFAEFEMAPTPSDLSGEWRSSPGIWKLFDETTTSLPEAPSTGKASPAAPLALNRPASHWEGANNAPTPNPAAPGVKHASSGETATLLLLRGGVTVRVGPWRFSDDAESEVLEWGGAAASRAASAGVEFDSIKGECWAVEVGWLVGGGVGGAGRREVLTTVIDARTMEPLGAWRGVEERVGTD